MLEVVGKKCKKKAKIVYNFEGKGGVETVRGREGGGGEGKPKGRERGERQQEDVHQNMVGI
jgi:hypothetical protein